jgi:next-to-BRCA1 protein 1
MASAAQVTPDTPVTVKVNLDGVSRRFKLQLRDVGINSFESKVRSSLNMPTDTEALFERYSDSAGAYVVLDQTNVAIFKQMYPDSRRHGGTCQP